MRFQDPPAGLAWPGRFTEWDSTQDSRKPGIVHDVRVAFAGETVPRRAWKASGVPGPSDGERPHHGTRPLQRKRREHEYVFRNMWSLQPDHRS